ncbi:hypothetical protein K4L44_14675 [Halosquirtibacter laminarini]|uniref:Uncharacterized protein n=1 Tax=Halosquirtibacter laminarini TaxID=3374600 RepID=A0AC61NNE7_9BACT|nr:hypothetical protein K4L44_14675 [Prolixibacteraceae bacterium]
MRDRTVRFVLPLVIILLFSYHKGLSQELTLYFMDGVPQAGDFNPAHYPYTGVGYIGVPGLGRLDVGARTNGIRYSDIFRKGTGERKDSLVLDMNSFYDATKEYNYLYQESSVSLLSYGFRAGDNVFMMDISTRNIAYGFYDKSLMDILYKGNGAFDTPVSNGIQTLNTKEMGFEAYQFNQIAIGYSRGYNDQIVIGFRVKFLAGLSALKLDDMRFEVQTKEDGTLLEIKPEGVLSGAGPLEYTVKDDPGKVDENGFPQQYLAGVGLPTFNAAYFTNMSNYGGAFDLGVEYKYNHQLVFGASIMDLGFIRWSQEVNSFEQQGSFKYTGVDISNGFNENAPGYEDPSNAFSSIKDSVTNSFRFHPSGNVFKSVLPMKAYFSVGYRPNWWLTLGAISRVRFQNWKPCFSSTITAGTLIGEWLNISTSYSYIEGSYDNVGLGLATRTGPIQFYLATDNILPLFKASDMHGASCRFGINIILGLNKYGSDNFDDYDL